MPVPKKKKREKKAKYIQRLIRHFIKEGYPRKQAIAIAINIADKEYDNYIIDFTKPYKDKNLDLFAAIF